MLKRKLSGQKSAMSMIDRCKFEPDINKEAVVCMEQVMTAIRMKMSNVRHMIEFTEHNLAAKPSYKQERSVIVASSKAVPVKARNRFYVKT